ncbi:hypothetical protein SAMN05421781_0507 [Marinococcus luteus]|uniref:Uncharacterized protein n=1 Tax=Marinococcus luteus TaxID=1122204 RepID=A0A1H2QXM3_9BACI|nr:hypothetical protein [Marinococcus luteus]SDW11871.1 hypothetical protein SAMN05421781_0507 [Marinococcus luteus]
MSKHRIVMEEIMHVVEKRPVTVVIEAETEERAKELSERLHQYGMPRDGDPECPFVQSEDELKATWLETIEHPDEDMYRDVVNTEIMRWEGPPTEPMPLEDEDTRNAQMEKVVWDENLPTNRLLVQASEAVGIDIDDIKHINDIDHVVPEECLVDVETAMKHVQVADGALLGTSDDVYDYNDSRVRVSGVLVKDEQNIRRLALELVDADDPKLVVAELTVPDEKAELGEVLLTHNPEEEGGKQWLEARDIIPKQIARVEMVADQMLQAVVCPRHFGITHQLEEEFRKWNNMQPPKKPNPFFPSLDYETSKRAYEEDKKPLSGKDE